MNKFIERKIVNEINISYDPGEKDEETCEDTMEFPITFDKFAEEYGFKDDKEVYTNGSDLIQLFRVKQWLELDNKLRKTEIEAAYECGKHANQWIPVRERLPEHYCLFCDADGYIHYGYIRNGLWWSFNDTVENVVAWMPLPEAYKAGEMTWQK